MLFIGDNARYQGKIVKITAWEYPGTRAEITFPDGSTKMVEKRELEEI